ncbi:sensor histidine kinase [Nocardioides agri]|uniref:sensor histidine kinase n=1 Tax=Nocardioides agri TaxID=2682843 RepID=UPI002FCD461F
MRQRLSFLAAFAAVVGLATASAVAYAIVVRAIDHEVDLSFQASPAAARDGVLRLPPPEDMCANDSSDLPSLGLYSSQLIRADGTQCPSTGEPLRLPEDVLDLDTEPGRLTLRDGVFESGAPARVAIQRFPDGSVLVVGRDLSPLYDLRRTLALSLVGATLLGGLAAWLLAGRAIRAGLRPVTRFVEYAEAAAVAGTAGVTDLPDPPAIPGRRDQDELARLERAVAALLASLKQSQDRLHQLVADAGHELRTPLSSLRNNVALLRRSRRNERPLPAAHEDVLLKDLEEQSIELSDLVDDLVGLSARHQRGVDHHPVPFDETVQRAARRAARRSRHHQLEVETEPWVVEGDDLALERAVVNLLDNALKFSPQGTRVEVELRAGVLTVRDRGRGVTETEARQAFLRFWRSSTARALPGGGLGLAIVADVAESHGGDAALAPRPGGGCVATLRVPGRSPDPS